MMVGTEGVGRKESIASDDVVLYNANKESCRFATAAVPDSSETATVNPYGLGGYCFLRLLINLIAASHEVLAELAAYCVEVCCTR